MFQDRDEISDLRIAYVNNREIDMNKKSLSKKRVFKEKSNTLSSKPKKPSFFTQPGRPMRGS